MQKFGLAVALLCKDAGWVWEGQTCYWSFFHQTSFKQGFNQYTAIAMIEPVDYGFQHFEIKQVVISFVRMICQLSVHFEQSYFIPDFRKPIILSDFHLAFLKLCRATYFWILVIIVPWFGSHVVTLGK